MKEKIYTIPVNEGFDASVKDKGCTCPFCTIYNKLEQNEVEAVLGPAMMEPDVRIRTNAAGFCGVHYRMMFEKKRRLQLGLILESHLAEVTKGQKSSGLDALKGAGVSQMKRLEALEADCYVCRITEEKFAKMLSCAAILWSEEKEFREKTANQPYFCLPHYKRFIEAARLNLSKKQFSDFYDAVSAQEIAYLEEINKDVSWFCKKFDYRYDEEPWYQSKDSIERTIRLMRGDIHKNADDGKI